MDGDVAVTLVRLQWRVQTGFLTSDCLQSSDPGASHWMLFDAQTVEDEAKTMALGRCIHKDEGVKIRRRVTYLLIIVC